MRWYKRNTNQSKGSDRVINVFLYYPRNINGEVRWLVRSWIRQEVVKVTYGEWVDTKLQWHDLKWTSKSDVFVDNI